MTVASKRDRLIDSAAELFHRHGMLATSLADIASHAEIPIGNVYYYFKTKDDLAMAVLERRRESMDSAYVALEQAFADPRERLIEAVRFFDKVKEDYTRYGCPIARLVEQSDPEKDKVTKAAAGILAGFIDWAAQQFDALGHSENSRVYAAHVLSGIQGATLLAKAFGQADIITQEVERLAAWLSALPNKKIFLGRGSAVKRSEDSA